ncbi:hypothetical protein Pla8534_46880 [Lignipirellula cremea]|uniref:Uncharacterized protein n=1 Tax=Lignipirellula cremea TaxID=2528010 RepID=A0A518DYE3_9BACT|nr:hypothetical protein Pla8534_46880 [Lignipirellula cremea]
MSAVLLSCQKKPWTSARRLIERNLILWFDAPLAAHSPSACDLFQGDPPCEIY